MEPGSSPGAVWSADIDRYREAIERYLSSTRDKDSPLAKAIGDILEGGGKRIRPVVTLLVCEAVSGSYQKALPVAAGFELAHAASLVQDDIIDESATRHGKEAAHKKYGAVGAILVSDLMIFEIFLELAKYGESGLPQKRLGQLVSFVGNAAKLTAEGEYLEMTLAEKGAVSEEEYVRVAELKTGSLFGGAAACGAVVGGAKRKQVESAYEFGLNLGISFQIRDDILDIVGTEQATGKPLLKDVQNNASNMVLVHALANASTYQKQEINSMLYKKWFTNTEVQSLTRTLEELGSVEHSDAVGRKYAAKAKRCLALFPESGARKKLEQLTEGLGSRTK
jgi:geranylgeranyl pyrophosphate synthase